MEIDSENSSQLYDNDWSLIEDENYRALADSYFDQQECKVYVDMHVLCAGCRVLLPMKAFSASNIGMHF